MASPTDRLLATTRRRTFVTTLALLFLLVAGIGAATAFVGLQALDADVDQALRSTVKAAVASLDGELPHRNESESDESLPAAADTFLLVLDRQGAVLSNASRIRLVGLPVTTALPASGEDLRTVTADSLAVRLLTMPVLHDQAVVGYVQGGFVLDLHDRQSASLVASVAIVAVAGLIAAALVTLVVTGRSLVPIRRTFEAQARFVADASHELRTPAALIRANAEVLDREALVSEEGQPLLGDIIGEADRLASLVDDLLALASSDATGLALQRTTLDVAALVRDTVRGAVALAAEHDVTLVANVPGPALAQVDRGRFTQVLLVLLDNAIDHAPSGSTVTVAVHREDRRVLTTVDDEGPGVAAAERDAIFEPFSSGSAGRRRRRGGTGLGLSIARRIVIAHGGTLEVSQVGGRGARFTVALPGSEPGA